MQDYSKYIFPLGHLFTLFGIWGNNLGNILWQLNHLLFTEISSFIVDGEPCDASLNITWYLKSADCYNEIYNFKV